ncbi:four-carbon acid sugar kinase family protein [Microbacterium sp.]|uniref:four-carbon acid sugar kinase family protein n=1 Tax=Microbacterium sp. TaxID=51671 RepID=UPI003A9130E6
MSDAGATGAGMSDAGVTAVGMIGAIADDLTGATDVAAAFRSAGLRVALFFGGVDAAASMSGLDAVVVGLKTRTAPVADAVAQSVAAARALTALGCTQLYVKYCSTFDSQPTGNIGPIVDAIVAEVGSTTAAGTAAIIAAAGTDPRLEPNARGADAGTVVFAPTTPAQGRTVYQGHLFVGDVLLSDSPMRDHPLTPMTDANLLRLLRPQTTHGVGLADHAAVRAGADAVARRLADLRAQGADYVVVDALDGHDLDTVARAVRDARVVTGAAGLAAALGRARAAASFLPADDTDARLASHGTAAVLAGSCSARTREQIARWHGPALLLDPIALPDGDALAHDALAWYQRARVDGVPLIFSSAEPAGLRRVQDALGADRAAEIVERALGLIAVGLVRHGVDRLVVAGGETSGAVVHALGVTGGLVGAEAAPGVPWIFADAPAPVALLLKSGNYGDPDLLVRAAGAGAAGATGMAEASGATGAAGAPGAPGGAS